MDNLFKKPFIVFGITSLIIALILFTMPINLFDGVIVMHDGLQEVTLERPLSLSYFVGMGYEEGDLDGIKDFYLTTQGYIVAGIILVGLPGLFAYRMHLKATMKKDDAE